MEGGADMPLKKKKKKKKNQENTDTKFKIVTIQQENLWRICRMLNKENKTFLSPHPS